MKRITRIFVILLAIFLCYNPITSVVSTFNTDDISIIEKAEAKTTYRYGRTKLENKAQRYIYDTILTAVKNGTKTVKYDYKKYKMSDYNYRCAKLAFYNDYPEYDYAKVMDAQYWYIGSGSSLKITKTDLRYNSTLKKKAKTLNSNVDKIIKSIPSDCKTKYQKALYLHDYICENTTYLTEDNGNYVQHSSFGPLVNKVAVCDGYSRAYAILLNKIGVKNWNVNGYTIKDGEIQYNEPHGWNMVILDGECYFCDLTWDDSTINSIGHQNFLKSLEEFSNDHYILYSNNPTYDIETVFQSKAVPAECNHDSTKYMTEDTVVLSDPLYLNSYDDLVSKMGETYSYYDVEDGITKYFRNVDIHYEGTGDLAAWLNSFSSFNTGIGGTNWGMTAGNNNNMCFTLIGTSTTNTDVIALN